jgi:hypothetical protein
MEVQNTNQKLASTYNFDKTGIASHKLTVVIIVVVVFLLQATEATLRGNQGFLFIGKRSAIVEGFVGSRLSLGGATRVGKDGKINADPVGGT